MIRLWLISIACVMMVLDLYLIFVWAPADAYLGDIQRIFYFHVPIAWVAFLAFSIVFVSSILYLWKRSSKWDEIARSSAEIGVVFASLLLITGAIWAKPVWGVWWTWEPRLTTSLVLWLIYVGYLMVRVYAPSRRQGAIFAAVIGIVGFVDVPIVYFAAEWWRSVHPGAVIGPLSDTGGLDSEMRATFLFSLFTFTVIFGILLRERLSILTTEDKLRKLLNRVQRHKIVF